MHSFTTFSLSALVISAVITDAAVGFALPFAYGGMDRDDNDTVGPYEMVPELPATSARYYMDSSNKRSAPNPAGLMGPSPRGPLDDCKSYFDCRQRFIKYLDSLAKIGRMGR
ncbi:hypothetical protein RvY_17906 [Ramazzottius varieornatus]|uniref:Uncharacterized protein n=1 Tax=Ramazzottius varieornatus TaxID=947166 RepID=A0A1D1W3V1_RAMVA|nr:hypothetical protein RvY_17906 [Ramazzottius varieornatus]